jgi:hypothetical protein
VPPSRQSVFHFIHGRGGMLGPSLSHAKQLAALVATLVHDVGHFALSNAFLTATGHDLALTCVMSTSCNAMPRIPHRDRPRSRAHVRHANVM